MKDRSIKKQIRLPNIDWTQVRPIYKKLSDEFAVLTSSFGFILSPTTKIQLDHLIRAIDVVDEVLDEIKLKTDRDLLSKQMISFLEGDDALLQNDNSSKTLIPGLINLRKIINETGSTDEFVGAAKQIFKFTESKRHVKDISILVKQIQIEGRATADMPLSLMGLETTPLFDEFFRRLCQLMGIVDLIFDAKDDFKTKKLKIPPSFSLYLTLIKITVSSGLKILSLAPKKWTFIKYCFRFGLTLAKGG